VAPASLTVWLALVKFRYHVTFSSVVCGALLFAPRIEPPLLLRLLCLYGCFNVLLYGGIYTLNDVADRASDARHPGKCRRPIASGRVRVGGAVAFAAILIGSGLTLGSLLFAPSVVACFGAALGLNAFYSLAGRNLRYLDLIFNSLTHPLRFLMGALLVDRVPPVPHLGALLLLAIALSCLRREVERDVAGWEARETTARYSPRELPFLAAGCLSLLLLLATVFAPAAPGFYAILGLTAVAIAGGGWGHPAVRASLRANWTR
jgi:4-hydroxybenzoate polyprenyltransferase